MKLLSILIGVLGYLTIPAFCATTIQETEGVNTLVIKAGQPRETISPDIYGHFAEHLGRCIYGGIWVGPDSEIPNIRGIRKDVLEALKKLNLPVLRWPGGCFADEYHWKDGIGPRQNRPRIVNTHWGMVVEDNSFGTHEFLDLCELLGCEAYIAGNVGSGTPEEMMDWVEYMTFDGDSEMANLRKQNGREKPWKIKYFGVGNENWGCGGNMTPEYYADVFKRYQTFIKNYPGSRIIKAACGPNGEDTRWMDVMMSRARPEGIGVHYYVMAGDWGNKGSATEFNEGEWFSLMSKTLRIENIIRAHIEVMDKYDNRRRTQLYIDEWGTWWNQEPGSKPGFLYQQNTVRDAVSAGIYLNEFNKRCDRIKMCNIAQTVNVLQAMVLTEGSKMLVTPTYHVFEMYKVHQGGKLLDSDLTCNAYSREGKKVPALNVSASKGKDGAVYISLCNLDPTTPAEIKCTLDGMTPSKVSGRVLTAQTMNAHNTFDNPEAVKPAELAGIEIKDRQLLAALPSKSVSVLRVE
ncbi:MAG: alpha-N-arabinofuranosidase [Planctomycetaceae bacterium]|nr:alpha-N-arabinofuranosidase [Planctomycetaceae bacterium]